MSEGSACLACITVTYNPDVNILLRQLMSLPKNSLKVLVDNASTNFSEVEALGRGGAVERLLIVRNDSNLGLAAALNIGVGVAAKEEGIQYALLLDQDTEPRVGAVECLLATIRSLEDQGKKVGCVGPALIDVKTGMAHGFHLLSGGMWVRKYPPFDSKKMIYCTNLNGSGTLTPIRLYKFLNGLDEQLFIDHVDTDWAFRVLDAGYDLIGVPNALFDHRMGESSRRIWLFGWRVWPSRSAFRHYYLFRNAVLLMKKPYVPVMWKLWAAIKLLVTGVLTLLLGPDRSEQLSKMYAGVVDAIKM